MNLQKTSARCGLVRTMVVASIVTASLALAACTPSSFQNFAAATLAPQSAASLTPASQPLTSASLARPTEDAAGTVGPALASERVHALAATLAADLAGRCPMGDAGDHAAFDQCRSAMMTGGKLDLKLAAYTLWGPPHSEPDRPLREATSTRVWPDTLVGVYLPLFMFSGTHAVTHVKAEKLYRIELGARFRNRLPPGQFPYRFWYGDEEWRAYEKAAAIVFWVEPLKLTVRFVQFAPGAASSRATPSEAVTPAKFDGTWMWPAQNGQAAARDTLLAGQFGSANPHLEQVESTWNALALSLREGQCLSCHVPSNPNSMKRLVLLQTPLHAASEIKRVLGTVKRGSMPLSEISNVPEDLDPQVKALLLARGAAFEKAMETARAWEGSQRNPKSAPVASTDVSKRAVAVRQGP